jgi:hypothetical protein
MRLPRRLGPGLHVERWLRAELAQRWLAFYADHPHGEGIDPSDRDPEQYLANNS